MTRRSNVDLVPRNGHMLVVGIVARISGCANQKEMSLDDQVDHAKEEVSGLCQGPVDYRIIATKGKGEALDRPELAEVEQIIRSRELDVLVMEDVGRLVRGAAAVTVWGLAVDHGVRCIVPNNCVDTADDSWEEDLIAACRDPVGHNAHTSKRLKKKLMNRFKKFGGAMACPIAGYVKPKDAQTYEDWHKDDGATPFIVEGLHLLRTTGNCSAVADWFNQQGFATGPYCRRKTWNGAMVRRYYGNRLLAGFPGRGYRHCVKRHETGRRVSMKNPDGPNFIEIPHLAHVDVVELDEVNGLLEARNANFRRKPVQDVDPLFRQPRKRTRFPGQHACCWYCGRQYVWGGNGMTNKLMCNGARQWRCWNAIGFSGLLAAQRLAQVITDELYQLRGFEQQFAEMVSAATAALEDNSSHKWQQLQRDQETLAREKQHLADAIAKLGARPLLQDKLLELESRETQLAAARYHLQTRTRRPLCLPTSVDELRQLLEVQFQQLAFDSPEFGDLLRLLVPEFQVYLVRLCDGGHLLPRARVRLDLTGSIADADQVPELKMMLSRDVTIDLFERPPQRERIRCDVVELSAGGLSQRQIMAQLAEKPKQPAVQRALALEQQIHQLGLSSPYLLVSEPPDDYAKLCRHRNPKFQFEPLVDYQPLAL